MGGGRRPFSPASACVVPVSLVLRIDAAPRRGLIRVLERSFHFFFAILPFLGSWP